MLKIAFFGGVGEFGKNMTVLEQDGALLVVDAGAMFPEPDMPGIDLIFPDFSWVEDRADRVAGLVLTHGHEDHIGASALFLERVPVPVWGSPITHGLLGRKLKEFHMDSVETNTLEPGVLHEIGPFMVEGIPVTHSIPDALSLLVKTPDAALLHSGDFKFDQSPLDGRMTHYHRFQEAGREGVTALLADSTNVEVEGITGSERVAAAKLEKYVAEQTGLLYVALFSTNLMRIQVLFDLACKYGKKVALFGRSMSANVKVGEDVGYLKIPPGVWIQAEDVYRFPREKVLVLVTGSQGEPNAALSRIAYDQCRFLNFEEGDSLLFSGRLIPGNERRIGRVFNQIYRKGADVVTPATDRIHVSGHAAQEEIKLLASWARPKYYIPVHGEYRQLKGNAALAHQVGIPKENTLLRENGDVLCFRDHELVAQEQVPVGSLLIDGDSRDPVDHVLVRDRRHLSMDGVVLPVVVVNPQTGRIESAPEIISRGYPYLEGPADGGGVAEVKAAIQALAESLAPEELKDSTIVKAKVKACVKKVLKRNDQKIPLIIPVVMEI